MVSTTKIYDNHDDTGDEANVGKVAVKKIATKEPGTL